ncbi:MAG: M28 family peptidase [Pseudomonadota bacterium]
MRTAMRRSLIVFFSIVGMQSAAAADQWGEAKATAETLIGAALNSDRGYDIIESLTTEVGPRLAGSAADPVAVAWAQDTFTKLGFERVRTQAVALEGWVRGQERVELLSPFAQKLQVTTLGGSIATPKDGLTGEIVPFLTVDDLTNAPAEAIEGKVVYLSQKMTRTQDGSGYGPANRNRRLGAIEAGRKGAQAVLIRSIGTDSHRLPHTGQMASYVPDATPIPAAAMSNPDADLLDRILSRGEPVTVSITLRPRALGGVTTHNVIADVLGREKPEEVVVIGAHLDSWDLGTGAVDDGAGVGIVMAAASLIKDLPLPPKRTIRVVLFGAEEVGYFGAKVYQQLAVGTLDKHVIAAESDFGAGRIWAIASRVHEDKVPAFKNLMRVLEPLGINYRNNQGRGGPDVWRLGQNGVPLASLMQDGRDYFDLHHTADDTFDKVDPANIRQNVAAYAAFAYLMAEVDVDWRSANVSN